MIRRIRSRWQGAVLVCRKCAKKSGGKPPLAKALRKHARLGKGRKATAGVIEVGCLGICPKAGVTVVDTAKPGEWMVFDKGTPIAAIAAAVGLGAHRG